jgi:hypothetical protein
MNRVVSLNFLYKPVPYKPLLIGRAENWVNFFIDQGIHVIGTPPIERTEDIKMVKPKNQKFFTLLPVNSFDTCDRWRAGLSAAMERFKNADHFFLWSADFLSPRESTKSNETEQAANESEQAALALIEYGGKEDLVVGTIEAGGMKEAIDQYAIYPLLQNWFPDEFELMMQMGLLKPRSELLRLSRKFLEVTLQRRWYPTEQTIYLILQSIWSLKLWNNLKEEERFTIRMLKLPKIPDEPSARDDLNVVQQVDRAELWLKYIWRDKFRKWFLPDYTSKCQTSSEIVKNAYKELEKIINEIIFKSKAS